jgi:membrane protease YdiL (CAAX protease family)
MTNKQKIAIVAPVVLITVMVPIFRILGGLFGESWRIGWYLGLVLYWIIWGAAFPWVLIGKDSIGRIVRPRKPDIRALLFVAFLLLIAGLYRFIPGMEYEKQSAWIFILLISTNLGNGFFEELLWRGMYLELFPDSLLFQMIWPSVWFGLWHFVPGSLSPDGNVLVLMIGSGMMGFYLSYVARKTGTIWWTIVAHAVGGFIMIV